MEKNTTIFEQAKEKYDKMMRIVDNKIRQKQRALEKVINADPDVIRSRDTIEEYKQKIKEAKNAFVDECKPLFSKIFFLNEEYKEQNNFELTNKYCGDAMKTFERTYSLSNNQLSYDACIDYITNKDPKKEKILAFNFENNNKSYYRELIDFWRKNNKNNINYLEKNIRKLSLKKKLFGRINVLREKYDTKIDELKSELDYRNIVSFALVKISTDMNEAREASEISGKLLNSKHLKNIKMYESVLRPYERSLENIVNTYKNNLQNEVDGIRGQAKIAALKKSFGKNALAEIATSGEDYFALGVIATEKSDKFSEFLRSEFSNEKQ